MKKIFARALLGALGLLLSARLVAAEPALPAEAETQITPESTQTSFWKDNFRYSGELRQETAFRFSSEPGFGKIREFAKMDLRFKINEMLTMKIGGRGWFDAAYTYGDHYPPNVKANMIKEGQLRDAYLDITTEKVNARLGHQQIVWGEALGQFFADVVTPKDLREFFLPAFEDVRLQIWAFDIQYNFAPNATWEIVLSPDQSVDKLALRGADFAFFIPPPPDGTAQILLPDQRPQTNFKNWNGGTRISYLTHGWDLAWLYYTSPAHEPALFKTVGVGATTGIPTVQLSPQHKRVHHYGMTFSKGVKSNVLRGEFVYTTGTFFNSTTPNLNQGVVQRNNLRYVLGFDASFGGKVDFNGEFQQQVIFGDATNLADPVLASWVFLRFETGFLDETVVPELIFIVDVLRGDTQISPRIHYNATDNIQLTWGADIFNGPLDTLYGEFRNSSRVFMNTAWRF